MDDSEGESVQSLPAQRPSQRSWIDFGRRFGSLRRASVDVAGANGQTMSPGPNSPLFSQSNGPPPNDYGTLPRLRSTRASRRSSMSPASPLPTGAGTSGRILSRASSTSIFRTFRRPKSAYDRVLELGASDDTNAYINGIRFYYSTYTSIDWLHDSIKDSMRVLHLRRRRSLRGRIATLLDRSLGV